jgi:hypothetical protein
MRCRIARARALAAVLALLLALTSAGVALAKPDPLDPTATTPTTPTPAPTTPDPTSPGPTDIRVDDDDGLGDSDVVGKNGGTSPFCKRSGLDAEAQRRCDKAHSIARAYPLSAYGIDNHIELGVTKVGNFFPSAIQSIAALVWQGLIMAINGVLLILEWAFSLDLVGRTLTDLTASLIHLNDDVLGDSWLLLGVSVAGLWGIWNGLVRLRSIQTLGSLAMTVLLMCTALVLIHNPRDTVGELSSLANESSLSALSVASQGTVRNPPAAYAKANEKLFDTMVLRPWCGLQFGDVDYCFGRPGKVCVKKEKALRPDQSPCRAFAGSVADAWLEHPAESDERTELYAWLKDHDAAKVRLQERGGTGSRLGLLALITVGLLGAIALLLYLAIKLMLAAIMALLLLLAAPVMLVVPAFGDAGRNAFVTWLKRLGGALIAKLVYALFLALVILVAGVIAGLDGLGWYPKWMLLLVFWWGVLIKRRDLVGFVMPSSGGQGSGLGLAKAYFGYRAVKDIGGDAVGAATYLPRKAGRAGVRAGRAATNEVGLRRRSRDEALKRDAQRHLEARGRSALGARKTADLRRARGLVAQASTDRSTLAGVNHDLGSTERELGSTERDLDRAMRDREVLKAEHAVTPASNPRSAALSARLADLNKRIPELDQRRGDLQSRAAGMRAERKRLEVKLNDPDLRWADSVSRGTPAGGEIEVKEGEVRDWIRSRERQLGDRSPLGDSASDARDRELILRVDGQGLSRAARREAEADGWSSGDHHDALKDATREIRRSLRREGAWDRRRSRMFRR